MIPHVVVFRGFSSDRVSVGLQFYTLLSALPFLCSTNYGYAWCDFLRGIVPSWLCACVFIECLCLLRAVVWLMLWDFVGDDLFIILVCFICLLLCLHPGIFYSCSCFWGTWTPNLCFRSRDSNPVSLFTYMTFVWRLLLPVISRAYRAWQIVRSGHLNP